MRVLVVGDAHGDLAFLRRVADRATVVKASTVLQVGDFGLYMRGHEQLLPAVDVMFESAGVERVVVVAGNHDNHYELLTRLGGDRDEDDFVMLSERIRWAPTGHRWRWDGVTFGAFGGAYSVDWRRRVRYIDWWPREELPTIHDLQLLGRDPLDVLVAHEAPLGVPLSGWELSGNDAAKAEWPRRLVRGACLYTKPSLVLHGHWHIRYGQSTNWGGRVEGLGANFTDFDDAVAVLEIGDDGVAFPHGPAL